MYDVYGTSPPSFPIEATLYPYPFFTNSEAVGSNNDTKSPVPPMNAPDILAKSMLVSKFNSYVLIPFLFMAYSSVIAGIPPSLPAIICFPFKSSSLKFFIFFLEIKKLPSFFVKPAKFIR